MKTLSVVFAGLVTLLIGALLFFPLEREALPEIVWFVGRLHPVVLHLPIGFLLALLVMEGLDRWPGTPDLSAACGVLLWLAALSIVPVTVAGVVLSTEGGYGEELLSRHRLLGGGAAVLCVWMLVLRVTAKEQDGAPFKALGYQLALLGSVGLIAVASHFGASMTHGSDYLTEYASFLRGGTSEQTDQIAKHEADLFADAVLPALERGCFQCHGAGKQKAGLRVDGFAALMKGGDEGAVVVAGDAQGSKLLERIRLPLEHDEHMPPEGKPQLTAEEIEVLDWWVSLGAPEAQPVRDLTMSAEQRGALAMVLEREGEAAPPPDAAQVAKAEPSPVAPEVAETFDADQPQTASSVETFHAEILPLFEANCFACHGPEKQKGNVRLDVLDPDMVAGADAEGWHAALDMINGGEMPPEKAPQPSNAERLTIVEWLRTSLDEAAAIKKGAQRTVLRRLTKAQYTNSLQDLFGLTIDFGQVLPDDAKSEMGFTNNGEVLQASPLHIDYYYAVAEQAVRQALDLAGKPDVTHYRVTFGKGIGKDLPAAHIGGYQSVPLSTNDFVVDILDESGVPIAGANEEEQAELDAIKKKIGIGLRGSSRGRFHMGDDGLILYSALPHKERVPQAWQGPSPNVKLEMQRCFPQEGDFVLRARASRGYFPKFQEEVLVALEEYAPRLSEATDSGEIVAPEKSILLLAKDSEGHENVRFEGEALLSADVPQPSSARFTFKAPRDGFYQIDLVHPLAPVDAMPSVRLQVDEFALDMRVEPAPVAAAIVPDEPVEVAEVAGEEAIDPSQASTPEVEAEAATPVATRAITPIGAAYLKKGQHELTLGGAFFVGFSHVALIPMPADDETVQRLTAVTESAPAELDPRAPGLRAFAGTRTDDGMDYATFETPRVVEAPWGEATTYEFFGRLENLPIPEPESGDTEILSGIMLLGVWNDYLVKSPNETGPPLLLESLEFEAPYNPEWPPTSHSEIFFDSPLRTDEAAYTREILARFLERAFRRPISGAELQRYLSFWRDARGDYDTYEESVAAVLTAAVVSPSFLYLAEPTQGQSDELSDHALAVRLSYFLWNSPPDEELRRLALEGRLHGELLAQTDRLLDDQRSEHFVRAFATEWLRLDRHALTDINVGSYPDYTRFVKRDMAEETYRFLHRVVQEDLPLATLIDSDFAMLNQNLAEFYGIEGVEGPHFRPVAVTPEERRGGLLAQGAFLAGHSDGTHAHPIKRAVWVKEKILGDAPPPPPPNVPDLDPEAPGFQNLTLKQQLELHRDKPACMDCHTSLDPYGVVFERYDAVGRYHAERDGAPIDVTTVLPDGTPVDGVDELKRYLLETQKDAVAASVIEHLFAYALGRDTNFTDEEELSRILDQVKLSGYRMRAILRSIVISPSFTQR